MDIITAEQALENAKGLTFEKVWATLMEDRLQMQQMQESQKRMKEANEESQKRMDKLIEETQKSIKDLTKNVAGIGDTLGAFMEAMFSPNLRKKFAKYGINVTEQAENKSFHDPETDRVVAEADVYMENGEYAVAVEVKTKLSKDDVDEHIKRLGTIRGYLDAKGDKRKLLGAVAGGVVAKRVLAYAQKEGLFVIVQSGSSAVNAGAKCPAIAGTKCARTAAKNAQR